MQFNTYFKINALGCIEQMVALSVYFQQITKLLERYVNQLRVLTK